MKPTTGKMSSKLSETLTIAFYLTINLMFVQSKENLMAVEVDDIYFMDTVQLIQHHGFAVEIHEISYPNYSLQLHRILVKDGIEKKATPVLFYHGPYCSSSAFVINEPDKALAFILSERGYDIWLGNIRGTKYSRYHTEDPDIIASFWQHSMDEIISEDMAPVIDYILDVTKTEQLYYYGHSTGATLLFGLLASQPEYNNKIKAFMALSPAIFMTGSQGTLVDQARRRLERKLRDGENSGEDSGFGRTAAQLLLSPQASVGYDIIQQYSGDIVGQEPGTLNHSMMPLYAMQLAGALSRRHFRHLSQIIVGDRFAKFDWQDEQLNIQHYQTNTPPDYDLSQVTAPTFVYASEHDILATPDGAYKVAERIANCKYYLKIGGEKNGYFYLLFGTDQYVFDALIEHMESV